MVIKRIQLSLQYGTDMDGLLTEKGCQTLAVWKV